MCVPWLIHMCSETHSHLHRCSCMTLCWKACFVSHIWMSHGTYEWVTAHMNESRHTYEWVTAHIRMNYGTHVHALFRIRVLGLGTHMYESEHICTCARTRNTYVWCFVSHIWMSHGTHTDELWHTCERVIAHVGVSHITRMNASCHIYMSHVTHMNESHISLLMCGAVWCTGMSVL